MTMKKVLSLLLLTVAITLSAQEVQLNEKNIYEKKS